VLVVMTGLPGSGKSMLAEAIGIGLPAMLVSVDPIEMALWRAGLPRTRAVGVAAYAAAAAVTENQLRLGHSVVVDAVNSHPEPRAMWQALATGYGCEMPVVEVRCSDHDLHRERLERRAADPAGPPPVTWDAVERAREAYTPWTDDRLVVDAAGDFEANVRTVMRTLLYMATEPR
jgi:predicted kinase